MLPTTIINSIISSSMFKEAKVAQMAAYFLSQQDEPMYVLKLMNLLYLSDRKSMEQTGLPITFDHMVSMPDGPVLSATLGYILGSQADVVGSDWESWVADNAGHKVSLGQSFSETTELTKLSQTDVQLMAEVWTCCKDMGLLDIKEYIHTHCSEWQYTDGHPPQSIQYSDVFKALGKSSSEANDFQADIEQHKYVEDLFSKA